MPSKVLSLQSIVSQSVSAGNQNESVADSMMRNTRAAGQEALGYAISAEKKKEDKPDPLKPEDASGTAATLTEEVNKFTESLGTTLDEGISVAKERGKKFAGSIFKPGR